MKIYQVLFSDDWQGGYRVLDTYARLNDAAARRSREMLRDPEANDPDYDGDNYSIKTVDVIGDSNDTKTESPDQVTINRNDLAAIMSLAYNAICEYSHAIPDSDCGAYNRIAKIAGIESDLI